jgi:HAD superfamily hydrolase (TIGR01549 family)
VSIRAVLFDLDQTLWRVGPAPGWGKITARQSAALAPHIARLRLDHLDLREFVRRFWADFAAALPDPASVPDPPLDELRWIKGPAVLQSALAARGCECDAADAERLWEAMHDVPLRHFNIALFHDAVSTVEALSAGGYRLAIVTARPLPAQIIRRELRDQGLPDVFEAIITSGDLGVRKPHPRVFESALEQLGIEPGESVVVGDSYEEDVVPAATLGMIPILKLNDRQPDATCVLARYQVPSLAALLRLDVFVR